MRKAALVCIAATVIGLQVTQARAAPQGPFCLSNPPFTDQFFLFFDSAGGSNFVGYGQNLPTGAPVTSYGFVAGSTATITITSPLPSAGQGHTFFSTAQLNLNTGQGPGRCEAVNTPDGCGAGSSITLTLVTCPAGGASSSTGIAESLRDTLKPGGGGGDSQ
jgi:hypothetical protein